MANSGDPLSTYEVEAFYNVEVVQLSNSQLRSCVARMNLLDRHCNFVVQLQAQRPS
jgi:hypothetical protein